jgi:KaiC/GvpD/RAD55 family RecA-like ATPase
MLQEIMNTAELKKELHNYIEKADERFLKMIHALAKSYEDEEAIVVGYESDGTPITKETLVNEVREASAQVKSGNYMTQEDLEKEV